MITKENTFFNNRRKQPIFAMGGAVRDVEPRPFGAEPVDPRVEHMTLKELKAEQENGFTARIEVDEEGRPRAIDRGDLDGGRVPPRCKRLLCASRTDPVNELHVIQVFALLMVVVACCLLFVVPTLTGQGQKLMGVTGLILFLLIVSSLGFLLTGILARGVKGLREQVTELIEETDDIHGGADKEGEMADYAVEGEHITAAWCDRTCGQRNAVNEFAATWKAREAMIKQIRFHSDIISKFWSAEEAEYRREMQAISGELADCETHDQFVAVQEKKRGLAPPNGLLTLDEMRTVVERLRNYGAHFHVLDSLCEQAIEQLAEEHPTLEEFTYHHVIKVLINLAIMYDNDVILEEIGMDRKNRRRARRLSAIAT